MTENRVSQVNLDVDGEPVVCGGVRATPERSEYAPPSVVKVRLDNMVRGASGGMFDTASPGPGHG